jgi:hypothetical protein
VPLAAFNACKSCWNGIPPVDLWSTDFAVLRSLIKRRICRFCHEGTHDFVAEFCRRGRQTAVLEYCGYTTKWTIRPPLFGLLSHSLQIKDLKLTLMSYNFVGGSVLNITMIFCGRFAILENVLAPTAVLTKFSTVDVSCVYTPVHTKFSRY